MLAPPQRTTASRFFTAAALLCALALSGACARSQMRQIAPKLSNMGIAQLYLGDPTSSEQMPDGTVTHEWLLDQIFQHAGGTEIRTVYVGHDSDGYREYREEEVYVPPWNERLYCRARAIADREGRVRNVTWEGPSCDDLPRVKMHNY